MMRTVNTQHPITPDEAVQVLDWWRELGYATALLDVARRARTRRRRKVELARCRVQRAQDALAMWDARIAAGERAHQRDAENRRAADQAAARTDIVRRMDADWLRGNGIEV